MKSWARLLFIFIAYGLALLHTAVPHHHPSPGSANKVYHAACITHQASGGLLQQVLSIDLGYGHLENFKKGGDGHIELSSRAITTIIVYSFTIVSDAGLSGVGDFFDGYIEKLKKHRLLFSVSHFRAPPL